MLQDPHEEEDERMRSGFSYQRREDAEDEDDVDVGEERPSTHHPEQSYAAFGVDRIPGMEPLRRGSTIRRESFIVEFASSRGPPQIVLLIMILALGFGSTIGVVG